jgi:hypothetical protein
MLIEHLMTEASLFAKSVVWPGPQDSFEATNNNWGINFVDCSFNFDFFFIGKNVGISFCRFSDPTPC